MLRNTCYHSKYPAARLLLLDLRSLCLAAFSCCFVAFMFWFCLFRINTDVPFFCTQYLLAGAGSSERWVGCLPWRLPWTPGCCSEPSGSQVQGGMGSCSV